MLYLGNFSFQSFGDSATYGHFNYMVEAPTVNSALRQIQEQLHTHRNSSHLFPGKHHIYLNQILEINQLPRDGIMTHLKVYPGIYPDVLGCSLPMQDSKGITAYSPVREDAGDVDLASLPPFLVLE